MIDILQMLFSNAFDKKIFDSRFTECPVNNEVMTYNEVVTNQYLI